MRWVWGDRPVEGLTITLSRGESFVLQGDALWRRERVSHFRSEDNRRPDGAGRREKWTIVGSFCTAG